MAFWATLPISTGDRYITARVSDATSSTIVVADVGGASAPVYDALNGQAQGFVVYDFHTGDPSTCSGQAPHRLRAGPFDGLRTQRRQLDRCPGLQRVPDRVGIH